MLQVEEAHVGDVGVRPKPEPVADLGLVAHNGGSGGASSPSAIPIALPTPEEEEAASKKAAEVMKALAEMDAKVFFEKSLTTSDAKSSGRVVIPKAIAEKHFPKLDAQVGVNVEAHDTTGHVYHFRFRFWINNQSRMYLLEGAGECHERYSLRTGDFMIFAQKPNGALIVAGRPCTKADVESGRKLPAKRTMPTVPGQIKIKEQKGRKGEVKRRRLLGGSTLQYITSPPDMLPPSDGIFRALPGSSQLHQGAQGVASCANGRWVASVVVLGELYQAFFDCKEDAVEAFNAAGELLEYTGGSGLH